MSEMKKFRLEEYNGGQSMLCQSWKDWKVLKGLEICIVITRTWIKVITFVQSNQTYHDRLFYLIVSNKKLMKGKKFVFDLAENMIEFIRTLLGDIKLINIDMLES